jgi:hypothetical protein
MCAAESAWAKPAQTRSSCLKKFRLYLPPAAQVYPDWMKGTWRVTSSFRGYVFPSDKIPKTTSTQDYDVPGFQKCSIAETCDVGKENVSWELRVTDDALLDREVTLGERGGWLLGL